MVWKKHPSMDEKVYVGTCPLCKKMRIHKRHEGKTVYCSECETWDYNSSLVPYHIALLMLRKNKDQLENPAKFATHNDLDEAKN